MLTGAITSKADLQYVPFPAQVSVGCPYTSKTFNCCGTVLSIKRAIVGSEKDMRTNMPRFQEGALEANLELVERVRELATKKGVTAGQLALAWVHAQVASEAVTAFIPVQCML